MWGINRRGQSVNWYLLQGRSYPCFFKTALRIRNLLIPSVLFDEAINPVGFAHEMVRGSEKVMNSYHFNFYHWVMSLCLGPGLLSNRTSSHPVLSILLSTTECTSWYATSAKRWENALKCRGNLQLRAKLELGKLLWKKWRWWRFSFEWHQSIPSLVYQFGCCLKENILLQVPQFNFCPSYWFERLLRAAVWTELCTLATAKVFHLVNWSNTGLSFITLISVAVRLQILAFCLWGHWSEWW